MTNPTVSIGMPVFNGAPYVEAAIRTLLSQSFKDFEFIIINDGSSDDSHEIMKDYALSDSRIKILSHSNIGLTASLIKGVIISKGKFIARIDADDISLPHRLEIQLNEIIRRKLDVLGSNFITIDKNGQILIFSLKSKKNEIPCFKLMKQKLNQSLKRDILIWKKLLQLNIKKSITKFNFKVSVKKNIYLKMIKQRYISTLLRFSSLQISNGINEINLKYKKNILFNDKLKCIIFTKV